MNGRTFPNNPGKRGNTTLSPPDFVNESSTTSDVSHFDVSRRVQTTRKVSANGDSERRLPKRKEK